LIENVLYRDVYNTKENQASYREKIETEKN